MAEKPVHDRSWEQEEIKEEFHDVPVPLKNRLGFGDPAIVWCGFGVAFICAVIGGLIQQGLGTVNAILAILLGNAILFVYSALIGYADGKWGLNFPLTIKAVFGEGAAFLPIVILALLVTGWFSFHSWLTGDVIRTAFDIENRFVVGLFAAGAAVLYGIPVIFGFKSMALVRKIAIPAMILFAGYYLFTRVVPAGSAIFESQGTGDIGFMTGVGMAWSTFVVSGTMTGDIVRYTKTGRQAIGATAVAFLLSNGPFMIMGALIAAAINDPSVQYFLDSSSLAILVPLVFLAFLSTWSTADACLYNAAMGFTNATQKYAHWRRAATLGMVIGMVLAGSGIVGNVVNFLILIGLMVPPIGGTIIADYYFVRRPAGFGVKRAKRINTAAIIASVVGLIVGYYVHVTFPNFLFGAAGILSSMILYVALAAFAGEKLGATVSREPSGAEAVDELAAPLGTPAA